VAQLFAEYRRRRQSSSASSSTSSSASSSAGNEEAMKMVQHQLGLSKNILIQDLKLVYGEKWMQSRATVLKPINAQAEELYTRLVHNMPNEPTRENIVAQKKVIITRWKEMYEKQFRRMAWANSGEAVMNFASARKADGKFPTVAEIKERLVVRKRCPKGFRKNKKTGLCIAKVEKL
jgi:hypothetical protein